jgi:hypothetical protein
MPPVLKLVPREARAFAWHPIDPDDTPWRLPKITERFIAPLDPAQHALVQRLGRVDGIPAMHF